jgi:hypothetical protein
MGRFYFHMQERGQVFADEEGIELSGVDAAKQEALRGARELLADAIRFGKPDVPEAVVIADEAGRQLVRLPLAAILPEPLKR